MRRVGLVFLALLTLARAAHAQQVVVEFYHVDAVGSVHAVTNADGATIRTHAYTPFGHGEGTSPTAATVRFAGEERDPETGFDYFGARYYGSRIGRFTTVDPEHVGGNIFDPQSWNAYAYARNNPLRFIDPTGTDYRVNVFGGDSFWVESDRDLQGLEQGGFSFRGGNIFNAAGTWVGTYEYFDPFARLAFDVSRTAGPGVNAALIISAPNFALAAGASLAGLGGTLTTVNLTGAAQAAALTLPAGAKLAQMIARGGAQFAQNPSGFLTYARDFVVTAARQGTQVFANWIGGNGATIYRLGNDYLVVAKDGKILSYVPNAAAGQGVAATYMQLGGK
jgi:RHS repeat-associated protein